MIETITERETWARTTAIRASVEVWDRIFNFDLSQQEKPTRTQIQDIIYKYLSEHHDTPAAPERGEWRVDGYEINDGQRSIVRAPHPDEFPGLTSEQRRRVKAASLANLTTIVTEHNQHSTLIAQRERLLEGLRLAVDWMQGKRSGPSEGLSAAQVIKRLESVITTSEQEGRRER